MAPTFKGRTIVAVNHEPAYTVGEIFELHALMRLDAIVPLIPRPGIRMLARRGLVVQDEYGLIRLSDRGRRECRRMGFDRDRHRS